MDHFGRIDILFANAGVNMTNRQPIDKYDISLFNKNIDIDLHYGTVNLCQKVLPIMMRQNKGSIIFTSSVCGFCGLRKQSGFVAAKFAVSQLGRAMALEYAKYNIRVNVLCPGSLPQPKEHLNILWDTVDFDDYDGNFDRPESMVFDIAARRPAYPTDMAGLVVYLASDDACYTTGQVIMVDGGWSCGLSGEY
jgi:NAD(P)-dependent dehydrogenase (short-subunit alcohol dehydrogenase family)